MCSTLTCCLAFMMIFILCGMGAHVAGMLTDYWLIAIAKHVTSYNETNQSDPTVIHVNVGLFRQVLEYNNGTIIRSDSSMNIKEENYLFVAIAGANTLLCLMLLCKAVHVFIGVVAFIGLSLMIIVAFYCFQHTQAVLEKMQEFEPTWPELKFSWSFILLFGGLLLNIAASLLFLTMLLVKGERKASKSSKGLGPSRAVNVEANHAANHVTDDKTPIVSTVMSHDNGAYAYDNGGLADDVGDGMTDGHAAPIEDEIITHETASVQENDINIAILAHDTSAQDLDSVITDGIVTHDTSAQENEINGSLANLMIDDQSNDIAPLETSNLDDSDDVEYDLADGTNSPVTMGMATFEDPDQDVEQTNDGSEDIEQPHDADQDIENIDDAVRATDDDDDLPDSLPPPEDIPEPLKLTDIDDESIDSDFEVTVELSDNNDTLNDSSDYVNTTTESVRL